MKILVLGVIIGMLLVGCKAPGVYETMQDSVEQVTPGKKMEIVVRLPVDASRQVMSSEENGDLYFCSGYTLTVQTVEAGDLQKTFYHATGFTPDQLSVMETQQGDVTRYRCVWTAAGETGDQVGRCEILDDGNYHYIVTAMAEEKMAGQLREGAWKDIFNSFRLIAPEDVVDSGS